MTYTLILFIALLLANLPWFSEKLFYVYPIKGNKKHLAWCLFELVVLYFVTIIIFFTVEKTLFGQSLKQGWEFYAITVCLYIVLTFPGFVYKTLWRDRSLTSL